MLQPAQVMKGGGKDFSDTTKNFVSATARRTDELNNGYLFIIHNQFHRCMALILIKIDFI